MQKRYHDFARFVRAEDQNAVHAALVEAGVLFGLDMAASGDGVSLEIAAGAALTPSGVVVVDSDTREREFIPSADPKIVTVSLVSTFTRIQAGNQAIIEFREVEDDASDPVFSTTVVDADDNLTGVVIGWIRYPGGSVALANRMLFPAPKLQRLNPWFDDTRSNPFVDAVTPIDRKAPYTDSPGVLVVFQDSNIVAAHSVAGNLLPRTVWTNNHGASDKHSDIVLTPTKPAVFRPKEVKIGCITTHADCTVAVYVNVDGTETLIDTITGVVSGEQSVRIPDNLITEAPQISGIEWGIRIRLTIPPTMTTTVNSIRVNAGPVPLE